MSFPLNKVKVTLLQKRLSSYVYDLIAEVTLRTIDASLSLPRDETSKEQFHHAQNSAQVNYKKSFNHVQ